MATQSITLLLCTNTLLFKKWDSSVGIVTGCGLDDWMIGV